MTLDQSTINSILLYGITAAGAITTAFWLGLVLWTWRDMHLRSRDPLARIAATLLVGVLGIFGIVIYVMLRPQETLAEAYERSLEEEALLQNIEEKPVCPGCARSSQADWQVCPYCHTKLKKPCLNCERLIDLAWNLCPYCAASQVESPPSAARRSVAARMGTPPTPPPSYDYTPASDEPVEFVDDEGY